MIRLSVSEQGASPRMLTFNQSQVSIGRAADCELQLVGKGTSSRHCRISQTPHGMVVEDLGSTNGTYVNRQRVGQPTVVTASDEIIVAIYEVRVLEAGAGVSAPPPNLSAPPMAHQQRGPSVQPQATGVVPQSFPGATAPLAAPAQPAAISQPPPSQVSRPPSSVRPASPSNPPRSHTPPPGTSTAGRHEAVSTADADWARQWEKLDSLAREWIASGRDSKRLLRGAKLSHARAWLAAGRGKSPLPKNEHRDFIFASNRSRQLRLVRNVTLGGLVLSVGVVGAVKISQIVAGDDGPETDPTELASADSDGAEPTTKTPRNGGGRGAAVSAKAAAAAASVAESDPVLATLLATEGLAQLADGTRGSEAEKVFRSTVGALQGRPLRGHSAEITAAAVSPDGHWAITASKDHSVRLWDRVSDGPQSMVPLRGHSRGVLDLAVTSDSKYLFTAGENGKVFRWGLTEPEPMSTSVLLAGHSTAVGSVAVSLDGRWLVSGSSDGSVRVWNASSPVPKSRKFDGHTGPIRSVAVDATGTKVLAASADGTASIWKANDGVAGRRTVLVAGTEEAPAEILDIEISGDGEWVITGHSDGVARLWDPSRRIPSLTALTLQGHVGPVSHVAFTPDSTLAITAGDDQKLRIWDLEAKDPSLSAPTFDLHKDRITALVTAGDAAPDGPRRRLAATASADGTVRTWNLERRDHEQDSAVFQTEGGAATAVAVSADGQFVVGGSRSGGVTEWPAQSSASAGASVVAWGHTKPVTAVATNPVGTRMVSASADGTAKIWDLTRPGRTSLISTLGKHKGQIVSVSISPDGRFVATGDSKGGIRMWDLTKPDPGAAALALNKHKAGVRQLGFTEDGKRLISLSSDAVYIWSLTRDPASTAVKVSQKDELIGFSISKDGSRLFTGGVKQLWLWDLDAKDIPKTGKGLKRVHGLDILAVGLSPKAKWAASSGKDATLVLWDLDNKAKSIDLLLHEKPVDAIAFSPDGHWLATGSQDQTVRLWDLQSGRPKKGSLLLTGHTQRIGTLRFSADGRMLVSASNDKTIRVYDLESADAETINASAVVLKGHAGVVSGIDLAADARTIVSGSYDLTARAWPMTSEKLVPIGCLRTGRSLERDEWETHLGDASFHRTCG